MSSITGTAGNNLVSQAKDILGNEKKMIRNLFEEMVWENSADRDTAESYIKNMETKIDQAISDLNGYSFAVGGDDD